MVDGTGVVLKGAVESNLLNYKIMVWTIGMEKVTKTEIGNKV